MKQKIWVLGALAFIWLVSIAVYPFLPEQMAVHWNAAGEADGKAGKVFGVFFVPVLATILAGFLSFLPSLDPLLRAHKEKAAKAMEPLLFGLFLFFAYLHGLSMVWNLGYFQDYSFLSLLAPAFAVLFWFLAVSLSRVERNFMIGFRTPWTISDDEVWKKTHEKAVVVFKFAAVVSLLAIIPTDFSIAWILVPPILGTMGLVLYSYVEYVRRHP